MPVLAKERFRGCDTSHRAPPDAMAAAASSASMVDYVADALRLSGLLPANRLNHSMARSAPARPRTLIERGSICAEQYERTMQGRPEVEEEVRRLGSSINCTAKWRAPQRSAASWAGKAGKLALIVRGQTFRGNARDTFRIHEATAALRAEY